MAVHMLKFARIYGALKTIKSASKLHYFENKLCLLSCATFNLSSNTKFSTSNVCNLKEITRKEENGVTVVEGKYVESPRAASLVPALKDEQHKGACPLCRLNLNVNYTDVLILSQFLDPSGDILPQEITGLCNKQNYQVGFLVERSKRAGLMPSYPIPPLGNPKWKPRPFLDRKYKVFYSQRRPQKIPEYQE